jgi:hypothetical protein
MHTSDLDILTFSCHSNFPCEAIIISTCVAYTQTDKLVLIPDIPSSLLPGLMPAFGAYLLFKYCMSSRILLFPKGEHIPHQSGQV